MKKSLFITALIAVLTFAIQPADACTSFLVGKKASTDGSAFITYNADSYGMFGRLQYYPAAKHPKGTMRRIVDGDTNHYLCDIPEAPETYAVIGQINEHQLAITETTFGGREELDGAGEGIDYVSLMTLGLQRAKTAREAIKVMTDLVSKYGFASSGESFSIADPNEVWIMEMIGKGKGRQGAVWVAVRIPDDAIACHANQSRIHQFDLNDKENVIASKDVISFARKMGYYKGKDKDFSFANAYAPADFSAIRFCEARVWSFYNKWVDGMDKYLDYAKGYAIDTAQPMPLYFKPKQQLSLKDVMNSMRDHYEGTFFDTQTDLSAGIFDMPYRPSPLTWEYEGKKYFNERPISTQQACATMIAQLRADMPNEVGGVLWWGNDEANMIAYVPVYCCATQAPACFADPQASDVNFSWNSAFWVCNWVANMTYPRYQQVFPAVEQKREEIENVFLAKQASIEQIAINELQRDKQQGIAFLTTYSSVAGETMLNEWKKLGEYIIVKYNDMVVKKETNGKFDLTPDGIATPPQRDGFPAKYRKEIIERTGDKYLIPNL